MELLPSSSRSFFMFFYAWNASIEIMSLFFPSSSILLAGCLQIGNLLCLCLLEFFSHLCTFSCSVIHSLVHDSRLKYECGFESGRFIGYEQNQLKKELNLTTIFQSFIFSFFFCLS